MAGTDPRSDEQLVDAANAGDRRAFEALYLRHRQWAADLAWRFVRDRDTALDVMQDAFLQLLGRFPGFRLTARMRTFLYPVVKHLALDRLRKARRTVAEAVSPCALAFWRSFRSVWGDIFTLSVFIVIPKI